MDKLPVSLLLLTLALVVVLSSCTQTSAVGTTQPAMAVQQYFTAWNNKDYTAMYSLVSDGFKKIEPSAASLESFKNEQGKFFEKGDSIKVVKTATISTNGKVAKVDYTIELGLKTGKQQFSGTYTVRNTDDGWKLIHPYGNVFDISEER